MPGASVAWPGGCLGGCLFVVLILLLLPIFPIVLAVFLLVRLWQSSWSLRTKRAITGTLIYPVGLYFLLRYTRLSSQVKVIAAAAATLGTILILNAPVVAAGTLLLLSGGFLGLFLASAPADPEPLPAGAGRRAVAAPAPPPVPPSRRVELPARDLRRLLEIEEARTGTERRLLLAREFTRVAQTACLAVPADRASWPLPDEMAAMRQEIAFLGASVTDPAAAALPDPAPDDPISTDRLIGAIQALDAYTAALARAQRTSGTDLEQLRILVRERTRVEHAYDEIVERLGAGGRDA